MAIIGMTLLDEAVDAPLSSHFGRAPWIGVYGADRVPLQLLRNTALHGKGVARMLSEAGCTDAVVGGIGPGAYRRLVEAGIRVWQAPQGATPQAALEALGAGRLPVLPGPTHGGRRMSGQSC